MEKILQEIISWQEVNWDFLTNVFIMSNEFSNQDKRALFDVIRDKVLELKYKREATCQELQEDDFYNKLLDDLRYRDFNINHFSDFIYMLSYSYIGNETDFYYQRILVIAAVKLSNLLKIPYQSAYESILNYWSNICQVEFSNETALEENYDDFNRINNLIKRLQKETKNEQ